MSYTSLITAIKGGSGSGNFGHSGRPGKLGGSVADNFAAVLTAKKKVEQRALALGYDVTFENISDGRLQIMAKGSKGKSLKKVNLYITEHGELVNKQGKPAPGW